MSTRSLIAAPHGGKIGAIYCHSDGYPSYMGNVLSKHYNTPEKVSALIALGNASSIEDALEKCTFYGRDRDESGTEATLFDDELHFIDEAIVLACGVGAEFIYFFKDGEWLYSATPTLKLKSLEG